MSINPYPVQQRWVQFMNDTFAQEVFEGGVPTPETIMRDNNGQIKPYLVARFSDVSRDYRGNAMGGARLDHYYGFLDVIVVSGYDTVTRNLAGYVMDKMLGASVAESGQLNKVGGGGAFEILSGRDKPAAYCLAVGFRYSYNFTHQS